MDGYKPIQDIITNREFDQWHRRHRYIPRNEARIAFEAGLTATNGNLCYGKLNGWKVIECHFGQIMIGHAETPMVLVHPDSVDPLQIVLYHLGKTILQVRGRYE